MKGFAILPHHLSLLKFSAFRRCYLKPVQVREPYNKFVVQCNSQITKHGREGNIQKSEEIFRQMSCKTTVSYTAMLTAYSQNSQLARARKVFDEMPCRSTAAYNAMITAYVKNGCKVNEAFSLFSQMDEQNEVSFGAMITGFVRAGMFEKAWELYGKMPAEWRDPICSNAMIDGYLKSGKLEQAIRVFDGMVKRDIVSWSSMVDGFCKEGRIFEAKDLFDVMPERNVVSWTSMVDGYMNNGLFKDGFDLFVNMREGGIVTVNPNLTTVMFEACGNFGAVREGIQIHGLVLRLGFVLDVFLGNSIITMYCRCGCMNEANKVFQSIGNKDIVSWNSLIAGFIQHDEVEKAYGLFEMMPRRDSFSWTSIISGYLGKGEVERSIQLFEIMPVKDDIAWTAVISGFVDKEMHREAFTWFIDMLRDSVSPNSIALSTMLSASACLATLKAGKQIHSLAVKSGLEYDLFTQNSLVSMYSKCGNVAEAYNVFAKISAPNIVSINSMITGFAQNGFGEEALKLFTKMQAEKWKPNEVTFLAVLSACAHEGLVRQGCECFSSMKSLYDIEPGPDHYACMVDLLGRAGLLDEATDLIQSNSIKPHSGIWGAVLAASRNHGRLDLANVAAKHLTDLEPADATPYVVLSGLYNSMGERKDGNQVRLLKETMRIKKNAGCSWTE
ncbi:Pentatricopeptide repeat-containing protein At1g53600, mitochondrial [Linum perenne]